MKNFSFASNKSINIVYIGLWCKFLKIQMKKITKHVKFIGKFSTFGLIHIKVTSI